MIKTKKPVNLRYQNLTISGLPGAGSSTLGRALQKALGWKYFSGGDFMRQYAINKGLFDAKTKTHHTATVYDENFDRQVDYGMRETLSKKRGNILDSWLSGFMAQNLSQNLKILVYCSNDKIRVDRIANRDNITIPEAKVHIFAREQANNAKWAKMYQPEWDEWVIKTEKLSRKKPIWFWYPELYDLCLDTYTNSKQETLKIVLKKLKYPQDIDCRKIFA